MQVIQSVQLNIPCIVLIRKPEDALASLLTIDNDLSLTLSLKSYINFYLHIESFRANFVVGEFSTVIHTFEELILSVNKRFGTAFMAAPIDQLVRERIFKRLTEHHNAAGLPENLIPIPTSEKERLKLDLIKEIMQHSLFAQAERIFQEFCSGVQQT